MSRPVDDKIVKLSLENSDFMSKVKSTLSAFTSLSSAFKKADGSLNLSKAEASVKGLNSAVDSNHVSKLGEAAETVKSRFSALGVMATTALVNISNRAVNAGAAMVKSFAIAPIMEGFSMYESKLKAIQVILANTEGKSNLGDVTKSLGELNDYANKTIYSFQDMTTNMGTFTAAGVDLKTSQIAIQGIGNLAASSGSSTQQAAMAMYQLSQAIAAGKVGLQDWNSVVNAGMGGKKFQTALQNTAKAMGKNVDQSKSFRESLSDGWLTTDVLMKTLQQFANDKSMLKAATQVKTYSDLMDTVEDELKSGWAQTFEFLIGGFTEAPKLWTGISNVVTGAIQKQANARNELAKGFVELGGRSAAIKGLSNTFEGLGKVVNTVKQAFRDVFPPATAKGLANAAKGFASFSKSLIMSDSTASKVRSTFRGLFSILDIGIKAVVAVGKAFISLIPDGLGNGILSVTASIGNMISGFDKAISSGNNLSKSTTGIGRAFSAVGSMIKDAAGVMVDVIQNVGKVISKIADASAPALESMAKGFGKSVGELDVSKLFGAAGLGAITLAAKKFTKSADTIKETVQGLVDVFKVPDSIGDAFSAVTDSLSALEKSVKAATLVEIAAAMVAMAVAMKLIQGLSFTDISKGLEVVGVSMLMLIRGIKAISTFDMIGSSAFKSAALIIALSNALMTMSVALKVLSTIDPDGMATALIGLAGSMAILIAGLNAMARIKGVNAGAGLALIGIATSLTIMSGAIAIMGALPLDNMVQGLSGLAVVLSEVAVFCLTVSKVGIKPSMAVGLNLVATSMIIMSGAVAALGAIDMDGLIQGLSALAALLAQIAIFSAVTKGLNLMSAAAGLILTATAMNAMVIPIAALASMDPMGVATALLELATALAVMVVAMAAAEGGLAGAAAIAVMAGAIALLAPPLKVLSSIPLAAMATALIGLAGAFTIMGVASRLIGVTGAAGLLAFSVAIGSLGLAIGGIGLVITGFTTAIGLLAGMTATSIAAVVASLGLLLQGLTTIIPQMVTFGVTVVTSLAQGLANAAPSLANSALQLIAGLLSAINANIYQIADMGINIVVNLANAISANANSLINAGVNLILSLINGMANSLRENGQQLVDAAMNLLEAILEVFIDGLQKVVTIMFGWIPGLKGATSNLGTQAKEGLRDAFDIDNVANQKGDQFNSNIAGKSRGASAAGSTLGNGAKNGAMTADLAGAGGLKGSQFATGVGGKAGDARRSGNSIGNGALGGANSVSLNGAGSKAGGGFSKGVGSKKGDAKKQGAGLGKNAKTGSHVSLHSSGSYAGSGFVSGLGSWVDKAASTARSLASAAANAIKGALKIKSPSRVMMKIGGYVGEGLSIGMNNQRTDVGRSAGRLATATTQAFSDISEEMQSMLDQNLDMNPVITPVIDASKVQNPKLFAGLSLSAQANGVNQQNMQAPEVTFGDISINVDAKDAVTAAEAATMIKDSFKTEMTNEIRKLRIVR